MLGVKTLAHTTVPLSPINLVCGTYHHTYPQYSQLIQPTSQLRGKGSRFQIAGWLRMWDFDGLEYWARGVGF